MLLHETLYNDLTTTNLSERTFHELMGKVLLKAQKSKLGTSPVVGAAKLLSTPGSAYYTQTDNQFACTKWNVFNAITQSLTNSKDFTEKPNKTIALARIILN